MFKRIMSALIASGFASLSLSCPGNASTPDRTVEDLWHTQCEHGDQAEIERNYPAAERFFHQALTTARPFGPDSRELQTSTARIGTIEVLQGHYDDAETYFRQSLTMVKNVRKHSEPDPDSLVWLDDFSDAYQDMSKKNPDKAQFCLEHCVALRNSIAPERHSKLSAACRDLSAIYMRTGKYGEAEKVINIQIACIKNKYGSKNELFSPLGNLAIVQEKQKKYAESEKNMNNAIIVMRQAKVSPVYIEAFKRDLARIQTENHQAQAAK